MPKEQQTLYRKPCHVTENPFRLSRFSGINGKNLSLSAPLRLCARIRLLLFLCVLCVLCGSINLSVFGQEWFQFFFREPFNGVAEHSASHVLAGGSGQESVVSGPWSVVSGQWSVVCPSCSSSPPAPPHPIIPSSPHPTCHTTSFVAQKTRPYQVS